jgi:lipopolysaccharide heptosyltransferase II
MLKDLVRRLYAAAAAAALAPLGTAARLRARRSGAYAPAKVRRILVLRLGLLGDAALLTPALRLLKDSFSPAEVHVLATPLQEPLLAPLPFVDRVVRWRAGDLLEPRRALRPRAWSQAAATIAGLRAQEYDLAIVCYGRLASAVALLSGARHRIGYAAECFPGSLTRALPGGRYDRPWHEVEYNVALARAAGAAGATPAMQLVVAPAARSAVRTLLAAHGVPANSARPAAPTGAARGGACPIVTIHPGATNGSAKRWPAAYWGAVASRLAADGATVVLAGGREERALTAEIRARAGNRPIDLAGRTSVAELLALLECADVVASGDSAPVHLAVALGRPTVAIYGPTDPAIYGPYDRSAATIVRHQLPCSPCYRLDRVADCPLGHTLCQRLIAPETVYAAIRSAFELRVARAGVGLGTSDLADR